MTNKHLQDSMFLDYAGGELSPADRAFADGHLASCQECSARLAGFRAVSGALDAWETPELSPWFDAKLRQRIAAGEGQSTWPDLFTFDWINLDKIKRPAAATAFAAALVVGTAALWIARPQHVAPQPTQVATELTPAKVTPVKAQADELLPVVEDFDMLANFDAITDLKKAPKREL